MPLGHSVAHDVKIEIHREAGGNRNVGQAEFGSLVVKVEILHGGEEPGNIHLFGQFSSGLNDAEVILVDPNGAPHFVDHLFLAGGEGLVLIRREFNDEAAAVADRFVVEPLVVVPRRDLGHVEHGVDLFGVLHLLVLFLVLYNPRFHNSHSRQLNSVL